MLNNLESFMSICHGHKKSLSTMYWWSSQPGSTGHSCSWRDPLHRPPSFPSTWGQRPKRWWCIRWVRETNPAPWYASHQPCGSRNPCPTNHQKTRKIYQEPFINNVKQIWLPNAPIPHYLALTHYVLSPLKVKLTLALKPAIRY